MGANKNDNPTCPQCGSANVVAIVYGLPTQETFKAAERGEIRLGGCVISGDDPDRACKDCGHTWRGGESRGDPE